MSITVFYGRTSTASQSIQHQLEQAKQAGFIIDDVVELVCTATIEI